MFIPVTACLKSLRNMMLRSRALVLFPGPVSTPFHPPFICHLIVSSNLLYPILVFVKSHSVYYMCIPIYTYHVFIPVFRFLLCYYYSCVNLLIMTKILGFPLIRNILNLQPRSLPYAALSPSEWPRIRVWIHHRAQWKKIKVASLLFGMFLRMRGNQGRRRKPTKTRVEHETLKHRCAAPNAHHDTLTHADSCHCPMFHCNIINDHILYL